MEPEEQDQAVIDASTGSSILIFFLTTLFLTVLYRRTERQSLSLTGRI